MHAGVRVVRRILLGTMCPGLEKCEVGLCYSGERRCFLSLTTILLANACVCTCLFLPSVALQ
jgi:predicted DNA-binding helix-hairpin-helix protein